MVTFVKKTVKDIVISLYDCKGIYKRKCRRKIVNEILAKHTGQTIKKIEKDTDRDNFLDAKAAKTYGIIDNILEVRNS